MIKVGVTGGIGSGKSTVCRLFAELGVPVYEADREAKRLMSQDPLRSQIVTRFGTIDSAELASRVFSNPEELAALNAMVHPAVMADFCVFCGQFSPRLAPRQGEVPLVHPPSSSLRNGKTCPTKFHKNIPSSEPKYVIMESALLFSAGLERYFDVTLTVEATVEQRVEWVRRRDGYDEAHIRMRIAAQGGFERADFVIQNNGSEDDLRHKVSKFHTYFKLYSPCVMGIVNVTPDSFYAGSRTSERQAIETRVKEIVAEGCDVIDIGGYSSRPGADPVSVDEEWRRVGLGMQVATDVAPCVPVSIDTFRNEIARRAATLRHDVIINDISAGELDPKMYAAVAEADAIYIAMHMRGRPETMQQHTQYDDGGVTTEVERYFEEKIAQLHAHGIDKIVTDPGFGFAKTLIQNYELLHGLHRLKRFRMPILSGVSRKSMIYNLLGVTPAESLPGTIALGWESLRQGATILRVHDVREAVDTVKIFECYEKCR